MRKLKLPDTIVLCTNRLALSAFDGKIVLRCEIDSPICDKEASNYVLEYLKVAAENCREFAQVRLFEQIGREYENYRTSSGEKFFPFYYKFKIKITYINADYVSALIFSEVYQAGRGIAGKVEGIIFNEFGIVPPKFICKKIKRGDTLILDGNGAPVAASLEDIRDKLL